MSHWIWKPLGWLIAILVTSGLTYWVYVKQSNKDLSYRVISVSPLGPLQARGFTDLRLMKGDKPIERPFLITIQISNTGDLEIRAADFEKPITIKPAKFGFSSLGFLREIVVSVPDPGKLDLPYKGTLQTTLKVIDARVAATHPTKIPLELVIDDSELKIKPLLLNVGDSFTIEILTSGDVGGVELSGRIAGVKQFREERPTTSNTLNDKKIGNISTKAAFAFLIAQLVAVFFGTLQIQLTKGESKTDISIPSGVTISLLVVLGLATVALALFGLLNSDKDFPEYLIAFMLSISALSAPFFWASGRGKG